MNAPPLILCIGGQDPTGGAGIQADIETIAALGGRALTLVSCLTVQDTRNIETILPTPVDFLDRQLEVLMADIRPDAIKLGVLGDPQIIERVAELIQTCEVPVVLDPVLAAGGGFDLDAGGIAKLLRNRLLPHTTLATPNRAELRRLGSAEDESLAVAKLLNEGCEALLATGADEAEGTEVTNRLFQSGLEPTAWQWPRLPHQYHGSGCTLASACATGLALGRDLKTAVTEAQAFAWRSLGNAGPVGHGQWLPRRQA